MSEEERRRKMILDSSFGMIRQIECMRNTLLLVSTRTAQTDQDQVNRFLDAIGRVTDEASEIERRVRGSAAIDGE